MIPPKDPQELTDEIPLWLRTSLVLEYIRNNLIASPDGMHATLRDGQKKQGLWDRIGLVIALSHFRNFEVEALFSRDEWVLPLSLRDEQQQVLRARLARWYHSLRAQANAPQKPAVANQAAGELQQNVQRMLTNPIFQYVESGSSPRGLIDWPRAAVVEAFLDNAEQVGRKHLRAVAEDVLRHRIRLTPAARAEGLSTKDLIALLLDTIMPVNLSDEKIEEQDATPVLDGP